MQTRPYAEKDGLRIWLSRSERELLLESVDDPRRRIALQLGLHGLRTDEIVDTNNGPGVRPEDIRSLDGCDGHVLIIPDGKTGKREVPISNDLAERIRYLKSAAQLRASEDLIDVSTRTVRKWMEEAREAVVEDAGEDAQLLGMHDLRRTWATDAYYSFAFNGVPIAEQLVMSFGGWKQSETGRTTFRKNYLGPVPDHVVRKTLEYLQV